jgi:hypothetical protein
MAVIKDVFISTGQTPAYIDVFLPGQTATPTLITDAILTEQGELLLTEDGLHYLALESSS